MSDTKNCTPRKDRIPPVPFQTTPTNLENIFAFLAENYDAACDGYGSIYEANMPLKNGILTTPGVYSNIKTYNRWIANETGKVNAYGHAGKGISRSGPKGPSSTRSASGHAFDLGVTIYNLIANAKTSVDIVTLAPLPDGFFKSSICQALMQVDSRLEEEGNDQEGGFIVRMFAGSAVDPHLVLTNFEAAKRYVLPYVEDTTKIRFIYGQMRSFADEYDFSSITWNHAKIILVDGKYLITGGENLWSHDYLGQNPVMDVNVQLWGNHSEAKGYVNWLFSRLHRTLHKHYKGLFHNLTHLANLDVFDIGVDVCCIWRDGRFVNAGVLSPDEFDVYIHTPDPNPTLPSVPGSIPVKVLPITRHPGVNYLDASTGARLFAMKNASRCIHISQQSLDTPVAIHDPFYAQMVEAIGSALLRGVKVYIITSKTVSLAGLIDGEIFHSYKTYNSWRNPHHFRQKVRKWLMEIKQNTDVVDQMLSDDLSQRYVSLDGRHAWYQHDKFWAVDRKVFYFGSHNMYYANLSEFGVICSDGSDSRSLANYVMEEYWDPKWQHSVDL